MGAPLPAESDEDAEREQGEKTKRRFQDKDNGKVKPDAVGVRVPEEEGRPTPSDQDEEYATEIEQRRHEETTEEQCGGAMAEALQSVRGLMPGKNKVEGVNGKGSPEDSPKGGAPAKLAPDARFRLDSGPARDRTPAGAQSKRRKDEKQNAGGELREQSACKAQGKPKSVPLAGIMP